MYVSVSFSYFTPILHASDEILMPQKTPLKDLPTLLHREIFEPDCVPERPSSVDSSQIACAIPVKAFVFFEKGECSLLNALGSCHAICDNVDVGVLAM
jgi:hypothetical protein